MGLILKRLTASLGVFCLIALGSAMVAKADSVTFVTPAGSSTGGGPVNASATLTVSSGTLTVVVTNLQANPTDVAQLISDISFTTINAPTGTLSTQSGAFINVASNGTVSSAGSGSPGE